MDNKRIVMFKPWVSMRSIAYSNEVLRSGWIGEGPKVAEFEHALCDRFEFPYALGLNSGTSALRLALACAGVGPGDEVISTAMTCTATNTPILEQFAVPVFADILFDSGNINPGDIEHRITEKTKAILPVHWAGYPCEMKEIREIAGRHGLPVIEDCAHALGATRDGYYIGQRSDYACFSFQAIKTLTTGDGGLLVVNNEDIYNEARRRRWFGIDRVNRVRQSNGYSHWDQSESGYKMHMNDIAAAIGLGNFLFIDLLMIRRRGICEIYESELRGVPGVRLFERERSGATSGNWLFSIHVENREGFCAMMEANNIEVSVVHIRNDHHTVFGPPRHDLPVLDRFEKSYISLPLHNHLTGEEVSRVVESIKGGW